MGQRDRARMCTGMTKVRNEVLNREDVCKAAEEEEGEAKVMLCADTCLQN